MSATSETWHDLAVPVGGAERRTDRTATPILAAAVQVAFLDLDDTVRGTYGYAKQGTGRGYTGVKGLNALLATICTPLSAPVIAATRLRQGRRIQCAERPSCSPTRWRVRAAPAPPDC